MRHRRQHGRDAHDTRSEWRRHARRKASSLSRTSAAPYQHWQRLPRDRYSNSSENCEYFRFTRCPPLKFATMSFRMSFRVRSSGLSNPPSPPIRRKRNVKALLASANVGEAIKKRTTPQKQPIAKAAKAASGLDAEALLPAAAAATPASSSMLCDPVTQAY